MNPIADDPNPLPDPPHHLRGRKVPRTKHARTEILEIENLVYGLVCKQLKNGEIKRALAEQYGLKYAQAMNYISRARKRLMDESGAPPQEHRSFSYSLLRDIATNYGTPEIVNGVPTGRMVGGARDCDRIAALQELNRVYGVGALAAQADDVLEREKREEARRKLLADPESRALMATLAERASGMTAPSQQQTPPPPQANGHATNGHKKK